VVNAAGDFAFDQTSCGEVEWQDHRDIYEMLRDKHGVKIYEPTAEQKAVLKELAKPTYDWWKTEVCPKYGDEILAAIEEAQSYDTNKTYPKYWYVVE
jgi:hypothetical protein